MEKYIELARKLKELADKGTGGEKVNAEQQLHRLMEKHGISFEDIEENAELIHAFTFDARTKRLFIQIASTVIGQFQYYKAEDDPNVMHIKVTASEAIEIESRFEFYSRGFLEEFDVFYSAFVKANDLYYSNGEVQSISSMSIKDVEKYMKTQKMSELIERRRFLKQIR